MPRPDVRAFFATARERYQILIKRQEGLKPPWTKDKIFQHWYFCNVFREDDKTTRWFAEHVRGPVDRDGDHAARLMSTVAFRWFNRPSTGQVLLPVLLGKDGWCTEEASRLMTMADPPYFTSAYVIRSDFGCPKHESIIRAIDNIFISRNEIVEDIVANPTLEYATRRLERYHLMGAFMAYEVVSDLRHTKLLRAAPDAFTWTNPGPGAARGLSRLYYGELGHFQHTGGRKKQEEMLEGMRELLALSKLSKNWPLEWPSWEMREVEHWLCEFDKYERVREGGAMKRRYFARR